MKKSIIAIFICLAMIIPLCPVAFAEMPSEVYTGKANGEENGTSEHPYSQFEDALDNVADGGTIYIKADSYSFINDRLNDLPFVINKSVTVKSESGGRGALYTRSAGILLNADVKFENIDFGFANPIHNCIAANGYRLDLTGTGKFSGCLSYSVFAGGMMNYIEGNNAQINISGSGTDISNIYAGGLNKGFDGNVTINYTGGTGVSSGDFYSSGADEAFVDRNNWFDFSGPDTPSPNPTAYPVKGNVIWNVMNVSGKTIDGTGCRASYINISSDENSRIVNLSLKNIDKITAVRGITEPKSISSDEKVTDIAINSGATLDLSKTKEFICNNFEGGGKLILGIDSLLHINGSISGSTVFETENGAAGESGPAQTHHPYIISDSLTDSCFTFIPCARQEDYIINTDNGELTIVNLFENEPLKLGSIKFTQSEISHTGMGSVIIPMILSGVDDDVFADEFDITWKMEGAEKTYISVPDTDYYGVATVDELQAEFIISSDYDVINSSLSAHTELVFYSADTPKDVYKITASYLTENGIVSDSFILNMTGEALTCKTEYTLNESQTFCTAQAVCTVNPSIILTEVSPVRAETISAPDCENNGLILLTSHFENEIFEDFSSEIITLAFGHSDADYNSICDRCGSEFTAIISISADREKCVRGESITWTVVTDKSVAWLRFDGKYTADNSEEKTFCYYYKASNYSDKSSAVSVTDNGSVRTWIIPMTFTCPSSCYAVTESVSLNYRVSGSVFYKEAEINGLKYAKDIKVGRSIEALNSESKTYEPYSIISVQAERIDNYITFTVRTTDDCTKVRISYTDSLTGKTKNATFQTTSSAVSYNDNSGIRTWQIKLKSTSPASDNIYNVDTRGVQWSEKIQSVL